MAIRLPEIGRVDGGSRPACLVGVGRRRLFAAAELLSLLGLLLFPPLEHLDRSHQRQGRRRHAELLVRQRLGRRGEAGHVDERAVAGGVDAVGRNAHHRARAFREPLRRAHCAPLVPPEQRERHQHHDDAGDGAGERAADAREPRLTGLLGERVRHASLRGRRYDESVRAAKPFLESPSRNPASANRAACDTVAGGPCGARPSPGRRVATPAGALSISCEGTSMKTWSMLAAAGVIMMALAAPAVAQAPADRTRPRRRRHRQDARNDLPDRFQIDAGYFRLNRPRH